MRSWEVCSRPATHLVFGWGMVCAEHASKSDPRDVFELGFDLVLDRLLIECSMELADRGWEQVDARGWDFIEPPIDQWNDDEE